MAFRRIDQDNSQFITEEYDGSDSEKVTLFLTLGLTLNLYV